MRGRFAALLGALLVFAALVFTPAQAQSIRGIGGGGLTAAVANGLYCQLIGCTMTGTITFADAVTTNITTAANGDLRLAAAGTGSVQLRSGDNIVDILDSGSVSRGTIVASSGSTMGSRFQATTGAVLGSIANRTAAQIAVALEDNNGSGDLVWVHGEGAVAIIPHTALVLATPTDVATAPVTGNAASHCRMSSTGVSAWTPQETSAVDGMFYCCTNTGTNVITMTESAGVYEGPAVAAAVGQFDTVCFEYITDRWVQRSFTDN